MQSRFTQVVLPRTRPEEVLPAAGGHHMLSSDSLWPSAPTVGLGVQLHGEGLLSRQQGCGSFIHRWALMSVLVSG